MHLEEIQQYTQTFQQQGMLHKEVLRLKTYHSIAILFKLPHPYQKAEHNQLGLRRMTTRHPLGRRMRVSRLLHLQVLLLLIQKALMMS